MKTYVVDSAMQRSVSNRLRYKEARQTKSADLVEGMKKRQKRGGRSHWRNWTLWDNTLQQCDRHQSLAGQRV